MNDRGFRSCEFCRHYSAVIHTLHARTHNCSQMSAAFPNASACSAYHPLPMPESGEQGTGYVWDSEPEGPL